LKQYDSLTLVKLNLVGKSHKKLFFKYLKKLFQISINEVLSNAFNISYLFSFKKYFNHLLNQLDIAEQINSHILKKDDIFLLSYWFYDEALALSLLCEINNGYKYCSRAHAFDIYEEHSENNVIPFRKLQFKNISKVFSVSKFGTEYLQKKYPRFKQNIETFYIGNFNENNKINILDTDLIRVISCGSIQYRKRTNLIYQVLKEVSKNKKVEWTHVGDGPEFQEFFGNLTYDKNFQINFIKHLKNDDLMELYRTTPFSFFISLSDNEGIPVSIMEAISFGIPIISTDAGGCSEIVNKEVGVLIPIDFKQNDLIDTILNLATSEFQSLELRKGIVEFWNSNFNAQINYSKIIQKLQ